MMFLVDGSQMLAEYLYPVTEKMAREIFDAIGTSDYLDVAVYGPDMYGKKISQRLGISPTGDGCSWYVSVNDYHPRKDGQAALVLHAEGF